MSGANSARRQAGKKLLDVDWETAERLRDVCLRQIERNTVGDFDNDIETDRQKQSDRERGERGREREREKERERERESSCLV